MSGALQAKLKDLVKDRFGPEAEKVERHPDIAKKCAIKIFAPELKDKAAACLKGTKFEGKIQAPDVEDFLKKHPGIK